MRGLIRPVIVALLTVALAGCAVSPSPGGDDRTGGFSAGSEGSDRAAIYAAVIRQLVTRDHTFGDRPSPFGHVYVVDRPVPGAGDPRPDHGTAMEPFPGDLKAEIESRLEDLPPLDFIVDPDTVRMGKQGMAGVKNRGAIITLGPIEREERDAQVPAGLWCSGRCGAWLTYVLSSEAGGWEVTGTTGPVAIS
jgi:hypothetical protein